MAKGGRRTAARAQGQFALAKTKSTFSKLANKLHFDQGNKPSANRVRLSDPAKEPQPKCKKPTVVTAPTDVETSLPIDLPAYLTGKHASDELGGSKKLPVMLVKRLEQMREECTSIGDDNKPRHKLANLNDMQPYLSFAITYMLCSILPLQEKDLPAVQQAVTSNIQHLGPAQLSSQPPPYQYISTPGNSFYLPVGNNGYGGFDGLSDGSGGGSGSNHPEGNDSNYGAGQGSSGGDDGDEGDDEDDGENGDCYDSHGKGKDGPFACPFLRHDPIRYEKCLKFKLSRSSDVKQHINRYHVLGSYYCVSCLQQWKKDCRDYRAHANGNCTARPVYEYLDKEEVQSLNGKAKAKGRSNADSWMQMWHELFPENTEQVSPFLESYFVEVTNTCRERSYPELPARLGDMMEPFITAGLHPTQQQLIDMCTQIQDICFNIIPVEPQRLRKPSQAHMNSIEPEPSPTWAQESRARNHSDPGPPPALAVPNEYHPPASAPLMHQQGGSHGRYLSVPPRTPGSSNSSSSSRSFYSQPTTQEQVFLGTRSHSFSGRVTTPSPIFSATNEPPYNGADPSLFPYSNYGEEYSTVLDPWGEQNNLDSTQALDAVGPAALDWPVLPYAQTQMNTQEVLGPNLGTINTYEAGNTGTGNTPQPNVMPSPSPSSVRSFQTGAHQKRKASKSGDASHPTAKRGPSQF